MVRRKLFVLDFSLALRKIIFVINLHKPNGIVVEYMI